jgi:lysophospholipase L1-like esterase
MAEKLPESMLDPKTPEEVEVTDTPRKPVEDPTLGIPVDRKAEGTPRNRLVAIGDSLTHGFQSGAIYNTDLSWPAIIAREMGWQKFFRYPNYYGHGGLPLNLEFLIRDLEVKLGDTMSWWESPLALFRARQFMDEVEDHWERGAGSTVPRIKGINHNLAIYGWDLRDALVLTAEMLEARILEPRDHLFKQIVENASERAALRVLNSAQDKNGKSLTPFGAAAQLGEEGTHEKPGKGEGIETLVVLLGANNALPSMLSLNVVWSEDGYDDLEQKEQFTVWNPDHFKAELDLMVEEIKKIKARHVILGTVPHVTIAPIARGVGSKVGKGSRYFPFYTRPWIETEDFDAKSDPHVTEQQARAIDSAIDQYNDAITEAVEAARKDKLDWYVFEVAGLLDRLAARRYIDDPLARPEWWRKYELPPELKALSPEPDSRFFAAGPEGRTQGGFFSLDGVHPTTIGYGILAQELIDVMQQYAGVEFYLGDGQTRRTGPVRVDFGRLISRDTLISNPPRSLTSDLGLIGWIDEVLDGVIGRLLL